MLVVFVRNIRKEQEGFHYEILMHSYSASVERSFYAQLIIDKVHKLWCAYANLMSSARRIDFLDGVESVGCVNCVDCVCHIEYYDVMLF